MWGKREKQRYVCKCIVCDSLCVCVCVCLLGVSYWCYLLLIQAAFDHGVSFPFTIFCVTIKSILKVRVLLSN